MINELAFLDSAHFVMALKKYNLISLTKFLGQKNESTKLIHLLWIIARKWLKINVFKVIFCYVF